MLKFRFFYSNEYHIGFARRFNVSGDDRYLVVLLDGSTLTIAQHFTDGEVNAITWFQVPKTGLLMRSNELVQILGSALKTAKEV